MDVQNISGTDIIPAGLNVNSRVTSENVNLEKEPKENTVNPEKEKGNYIDTKA